MHLKTPNLVPYFAYGSNLCLPHLQNWLRRFGVQPSEVSHPRRVILPHFCIRTNYLTGASLGAANIEASRGNAVEGLLLTVSPDAQTAIRAKEGWPRRYEEIEVEVTSPRGDKATTAITYRVAERHRLPIDIPVSTRYRDLVLQGARAARLSPAYQMLLGDLLKTSICGETIETIIDCA